MEILKGSVGAKDKEMFSAILQPEPLNGHFPDAQVLIPVDAPDKVLHLEQAVTNIRCTMESMTASLDSQVAQLASMG